MERRPRVSRLPCLVALLVLLVAGVLVPGDPAGAATPAPPSISQIYLTTDQAYTAFDPSRAVAPPAVTHFPVAVQYLAVYFSFAGAKARKTIFRVDFLSGSKTVRRGETHPLLAAQGRYLLDLPGGDLSRQGRYRAVLYLGTRSAASTTFWVIKAPAVRLAYLITSTAWSRYNPAKRVRPGRAGPVKAGTKKIGVYLEYGGAAHGATVAIAVYDRYGRLSSSSGTHALLHLPTGAAALLLPASGGSYPAGPYRADLYLDGALVDSLSWHAA